MTKAKMNEEVLTLCEKFGASVELTAALNELTAPKVGGVAADINEYTRFDEEGNVSEIFCNTFKQWLPVSEFNASSTNKNGYNRDSNPGIKASREATKVFKASEKAILNDVLDGVITGPEAKAAIEELKASQPALVYVAE
jgi:hypothetical protein